MTPTLLVAADPTPCSRSADSCPFISACPLLVLFLSTCLVSSPQSPRNRPLIAFRSLLNDAGVKTYYGQHREWTKHKIFELLRTMGIHKGKTVDSTATHDQRAAYRIAYRLRSEGRIYREIADELNQQNLRPKNAARYAEWSVKDLIRSAVYHDRGTARGLALYLKEQGHSLREIGLRLAQAGHFPKRGGQWYPNTVRLLMVS